MMYKFLQNIVYYFFAWPLTHIHVKIKHMKKYYINRILQWVLSLKNKAVKGGSIFPSQLHNLNIYPPLFHKHFALWLLWLLCCKHLYQVSELIFWFATSSCTFFCVIPLLGCTWELFSSKSPPSDATQASSHE